MACLVRNEAERALWKQQDQQQTMTRGDGETKGIEATFEPESFCFAFNYLV